jgi:hypothetical protein
VRDGPAKFRWQAQIPLPLDVRSERFAQLHAARSVSVPFCFFSDSLELFLKASQIFVGKFFQIDKFISSAFQGSNYFVEFQMSRFGIAILRILNEKDH